MFWNSLLKVQQMTKHANEKRRGNQYNADEQL